MSAVRWNRFLRQPGRMLSLQGGLPGSLRRATNCQKLQLTIQSWDALTQVAPRTVALTRMLLQHETDVVRRHCCSPK